MNLLDAIPSTPSSFTEICGALGLPAPTPELRAEMHALLAGGFVQTSGAARWTRYWRGSPSEEGVGEGEKASKGVESLEGPEMDALLSGVSDTLSSFAEILQRVGLPVPPTPEQRNLLKLLISQGKVTQVGVKRGAKYALATSQVLSEAPKPPSQRQAAPAKVQEEEPEDASISQEEDLPSQEEEEGSLPVGALSVTESTNVVKIDNWVRGKTSSQRPVETWLDPTKHILVTWEIQEGLAHEWLLANWATLGEPSDFILEIGYRISQTPGCPFNMLVLCNAICDLAQLGKIPAKLVTFSDSHIPQVKYGTWPDSPFASANS